MNKICKYCTGLFIASMFYYNEHITEAGSIKGNRLDGKEYVKGLLSAAVAGCIYLLREWKKERTDWPNLVHRV